jgi:hypothetical protein
MARVKRLRAPLGARVLRVKVPHMKGKSPHMLSSLEPTEVTK